MVRGEVPEEESWMEGPISKEEVSLQVDKNFPESWADPATVLSMANPEFSEEAVDTGSCVNRVGGRATSIMQLTKLGFLGPAWRHFEHKEEGEEQECLPWRGREERTPEHKDGNKHAFYVLDVLAPDNPSTCKPTCTRERMHTSM